MAAVDLLDPQWRCGVPYERLGGTLVEHARRVPAETGVAPSGSMWFRRAKTRNPFAVVLIRVSGRLALAPLKSLASWVYRSHITHKLRMRGSILIQLSLTTSVEIKLKMLEESAACGA